MLLSFNRFSISSTAPILFLGCNLAICVQWFVFGFPLFFSYKYRSSGFKGSIISVNVNTVTLFDQFEFRQFLIIQISLENVKFFLTETVREAQVGPITYHCSGYTICYI